MQSLFNETTAVLFATSSVFFGILSLAKIFHFIRDPDPSHRIKGATKSSIFLCLSALSFFFTAEIYKPNVMCLPALLFFLALVWMDHWAYKRIVHSQPGKDGGNPNSEAFGGNPQGNR